MVLGYDENGQPIYDGYLDESTLSRGHDQQHLMPPGANSSMYKSEDDLLAEQGYNAETGTTPTKPTPQTPSRY